MFENESKEYARKNTSYYGTDDCYDTDTEKVEQVFKNAAETTLRKVIKYFSTRTLDEYCSGYFSRLLESEEELQKLAKELENV